MEILTLPCGCTFNPPHESRTPLGLLTTWYTIRTPCERHKDLYMKQKEPNPLDCICTEDDCRGQECDFCWRSDPRIPCPAMEE